METRIDAGLSHEAFREPDTPLPYYLQYTAWSNHNTPMQPLKASTTLPPTSTINEHFDVYFNHPDFFRPIEMDFFT